MVGPYFKENFEPLFLGQYIVLFFSLFYSGKQSYIIIYQSHGMN